MKESDEWKADTSEKLRNYVSKTWLPVSRVSDALKTKFKCKIRRLISDKTVNLPLWKCSLKDLSLKEKCNCYERIIFFSSEANPHMLSLFKK